MSTSTAAQLVPFALGEKPKLADDALNESLRAFFGAYVERLGFVNLGDGFYQKTVGIQKDREILMWFDQTLHGETWYTDSDGEESRSILFYSGVMARTPEELQFLLERSLTMQMHVFNPEYGTL